jgi:hypothetical protein
MGLFPAVVLVNLFARQHNGRPWQVKERMAQNPLSIRIGSQMAKKCKEKREGRIGDTVKRFDVKVRRHLAVPKGSGGFHRQLRCKSLKEITLPADLRLLSQVLRQQSKHRGEILADQSRTINGF